MMEHQRLFNGRLEGIMIAETPIFTASGESKGRKEDTLDQCIQWELFTPGGEGVVSLPVIQGSSIRGVMRDIGAAIIAKQVGGFDRIDDIRLYFSGGSAKTDDNGGVEPGDLATEKELRREIPFLSLFGGQIKSIIEGHLRVGFAIPITEASRHLVPDYFEGIMPHSGSVTVKSMLTRRDDVISKPDTELYMLDEALGERDEIMRKIEEEGGKSIQMIRRFEAIRPGTNMYHRLGWFSATEEEIGLLMEILSQFSERPYLGGRSSSGYGQVSVRYHLIMDGKKHDNVVTVSQLEGFRLDNAFLEGCRSKFSAWLSGFTRDKATMFRKAEKKG